MSRRRAENMWSRLYTLVLYSFPRRIRRQYGTQMTDDFRAAHAERTAESPAAARRYFRRAAGDALRAGTKERFHKTRPGSAATHSAPSLLSPSTNSRSAMLWGDLRADVRYAVRLLQRSPAFTAAVVVVLALGVGINGAIFSAVNAAVLAPLPYPAPEELVIVDLLAIDVREGAPGRAFPWSWPKYRAMATAGDFPLAALAAYATSRVTLTGGGEAARLGAEIITPGYFSLLGVEPVGGRTLSIDAPEIPSTEVIIAHGLWQQRFGADPSIIGRSITLNDKAMEVVGVAPPRFKGLSGTADLWFAVAAAGELISPVRINGAQAHWLQAIGRMRDDVPFETLQERLAVIAAGVDEAFPLAAPDTEISGGARLLARRAPIPGPAEPWPWSLRRQALCS